MSQAPSVLTPPGLGEPRVAPLHRRAGVHVGPLAVALAGVTLLLALVLAGALQPAAAVGAGAALAAFAGLVAFTPSRTRTDGRSAFATAGPAASEAEVGIYALALELAPNPVLIVTAGDVDDIAGRRITFANAEARTLLRIVREDALLVAALRQPQVLEAVDEALFGRVTRVAGWEPAGGGSDRFWRVWAKPLPETSARLRQALVILRDETDVRTHERMRSDFLANASHELRTPLASLTGFIETLRGHAKEDPEARDRFLAIMARQGERMARLIDDLLSLSRIELNEHVRPDGVCDLTQVVGDVVDALAPQIAAKSVRLALNLPPAGHARVTGERDQLLQVAQNLIDNAVKYSSENGLLTIRVSPDLTLEAASALKPGDPRLASADGGRMALVTPVRSPDARFALLTVDDAGPGMAREHLPRLTERFYRVEGQKSGERMGTGLGLAIVKHIVARHRGGFFVESAPGLGAAFHAYLPMAEEAAGQNSGDDVIKLS